MKQEVIQDFLNLPGIVGFALMDGRSRPYFYGVDGTLNFQQKEVLAQGILQVIETIPEGFKSFKFQFAGHQAYLYKVEQEMILLVLTCDELVYSDYLQTIKNLKAALRADVINAIAKFRFVAGTLTQSSSISQSLKPPSERNNAIPFAPTLAAPDTSAPPRPGSSTNISSPTTNIDSVSVVWNNWASPVPPDTPVTSAGSLNDVLLALNHLSHFTTRYLGTQVIVNYWKSTRPPHPWLSHFQVDRSAQITFTSETGEELQQPISPDQQQWVQEWVAAFIKRCSQIVRDFPDLIQQAALTDEQKSLLLG